MFIAPRVPARLALPLPSLAALLACALASCATNANPGSGFVPYTGGCIPQCSGRQCGANGCGGVCGTCPDDAPFCSTEGSCQVQENCSPTCDGAKCDDGCGGTCEGQKCWDGTPCTTSAVCIAGQCKQVGATPCDDGDPCTADSCTPGSGCTYGPASGGTCNDNDACSTGDTCTDGKCKGIFKLECKDGDPCTVDSCVTGKGCTFAPAADFTSCGAGGLCVNGGCCTCPSGKACNDKGLCVAPNSCAGKCGDYAEGASCQCDSECGGFGDCCPDMDAVCGSCLPNASEQCCGSDLCQYDSCGKQESKVACLFGCEPISGATAMCKDDPCGGFSSDGECISESFYAYCAVIDGSGMTPELQFGECSTSEVCDDSMGFIWCSPKAGSCQPGAIVCATGKPDVASVCDNNGKWTDASCPTCTTTSLGSMVACPGSIALQPMVSSVSYDHILPTTGFTGFATNAPQPWIPVYALVVSVRYTSDFSSSTFFDATTVGPNGQFTVKVPSQPTAYDFVLLMSVGYDPETNNASVGVFKPSGVSGVQAVDPGNFLSGAPHVWAVGVSTLKSADSWHITSSEGSWALQVFNAARYDFYNGLVTQWGKAGRTLAVWASEGVDFDCGACFAQWGTEGGPLLGADAQSQIWISTSANHQLSDAVTHHEMGHWAMASYGTSPGEGGKHYIGVKVPPGMGLSEGWATFYSSAARGDPIYFSPGGGGMFWLSLASAKYDDGSLLHPFESGDLLQFVDENRVAALLWQTATQGTEPFKQPGNAPFWSALASYQMNDGKFTRGYKQQVWTDVSPTGLYTGLQKTQTPAPMIADYLDALLCKAPSLASKVQVAKGAFAFPVNNPICK